MTATTDALSRLYHARCDLVRSLRALGADSIGIDGVIQNALPEHLRSCWVTYDVPVTLGTSGRAAGAPSVVVASTTGGGVGGRSYPAPDGPVGSLGYLARLAELVARLHVSGDVPYPHRLEAERLAGELRALARERGA